MKKEPITMQFNEEAARAILAVLKDGCRNGFAKTAKEARESRQKARDAVACFRMQLPIEEAEKGGA
tara:strand:- start:2393 stop:2590 length:198 start_codon:yes stop_codon:yes gene_type:complete